MIRHAAFLQSTGQKAKCLHYGHLAKNRQGNYDYFNDSTCDTFIFGSIREGLGGKLILAAVIGVSVYLLDQIVANAGLLLHMNPVLTSIYT